MFSRSLLKQKFVTAEGSAIKKKQHSTERQKKTARTPRGYWTSDFSV
jgi:hypothetical protein